MIRFILNEKEVSTDLPPATLLLDYIRYHRQLTGTKVGCREGDCGACTVLVGEVKAHGPQYQSVTSCLTALANVQGRHVVTIEGLNGEGLSPVQQAVSDEAATQCGFCTPGFVVSLTGFCLSETDRGPEAALASVNGNICRCTGYKSIERAAAKVAAMLSERTGETAIDFATGHGFLPPYFKSIPQRLTALAANGEASNADAQLSTAASSRYLGGGTDLYVQQPEAMTGTAVNSLFSNQSLKGIVQQGGTCCVGGAATVTDILSSPVFRNHFPSVHKFIRLVSSTPIRNMATVGGNLVNASPIGDLTIFFLALDAQVHLTSGLSAAGPERRAGGERTVPLRAFYKGYKTLDKAPDEYVSALSFTLPDEQTFFNFEKVCKRTHLDIASVNTAIRLKTAGGCILEASVSAGGVGPVPMRLQKASAFLAGKSLGEEAVLEAIEIAQTEISPVSDVRGSEAYKRLLLSQLIKAHFLSFAPSLLNPQRLLA